MLSPTGDEVPRATDEVPIPLPPSDGPSSLDLSARADVAPRIVRAAQRRRYSSDYPTADLTMPQRQRVVQQRQSLDLSTVSSDHAGFAEVVREVIRQQAGPLQEASSTVSGRAEAQGQRYMEMVERFQIRRLSRTASTSSVKSTKATSRDLVAAATATARDGDELPAPDIHGPTQAHNMSIEVAGGDDTESRPDPPLPWQRRLARATSDLVVAILPTATSVSRGRLALLVGACGIHIVTFPLRVAFHSAADSSSVVLELDTAVDFIFIVDFMLVVNAACSHTYRQLKKTPRRLTTVLRGWLTIDLLSSLPANMVLVFVGSHSVASIWLSLLFDVILRSLRITGITRALSGTARDSPERRLIDWILYSRYSHLLRIAWIVLCIAVFAHYLACGWRLLGLPVTPRSSAVEQYVSCFYDVLQLLQGQGVPTATVAQNIYATIAILMGSIALAIIFGHVAILVSNFNANDTNYQRKMEAVFAVMGKLQLPPPLRERIHQYYEHLRREYESVDGEIVAFSKGLSHTLELEVVLYKYMDLIMHVPLWRDASPDFQKQLMLHLHVRVYLPDDFIIRRGEVGDEFYMINRGVCVLELGPDSFECTTDPLTEDLESLFSESDGMARANVNYYRPPNAKSAKDRSGTDCKSGVNDATATDDSTNYIKTLTRGQSFGEMALLMNYERTANARASTYVEMCVLQRKDFQSILVRHPQDRKDVLTAILSKTMENNEATSVWCPLRETVQSVFGNTEKTEPISAIHAALLISNAVNLPLQDESITFGIGERLRDQLEDLRDKEHDQYKAARETRVFQPSPPSPPAPPSPAMTACADAVLNPSIASATTRSLNDRIEHLGHVQTHLTTVLSELSLEVRGLRLANDQLQTVLAGYEARLTELQRSADASPMRSPPPRAPLGREVVPAKVVLPARLARRSSRIYLDGTSVPENDSRVQSNLIPQAVGTTPTHRDVAHAIRIKQPMNRRASFASYGTAGTRDSVLADKKAEPGSLSGREKSSLDVSLFQSRESPRQWPSPTVWHHHYRSHNKMADKAANQAMDGGASYHAASGRPELDALRVWLHNDVRHWILTQETTRTAA